MSEGQAWKQEDEVLDEGKHLAREEDGSEQRSPGRWRALVACPTTGHRGRDGAGEGTTQDGSRQAMGIEEPLALSDSLPWGRGIDFSHFPKPSSHPILIP